MYALEIKDFTKRYGSHVAVHNLNLKVEVGEVFGLLGPNGAGKTTTIGAICGLNNFEEGTITVYGHDVQEDPVEAKKKIGLSAQEYNVDFFMNLKKILDIVGGYYGLKSAQRKKRIQELLLQFDLVEHARKPFRRLSGGMKRRAMIARAVIHEPELLILDEPTAALDVELRYELWDYIRKLNKEGKTIILTSHYIEEIELLCKNVAIINKGQLLYYGPKEKLIQKHKSLESAYREYIKDNAD